MAERLHYEVEGDADDALAKAARRLERIGAADGEHVEIELDVTFGPPEPPATVNVDDSPALEPQAHGDADLSSFGAIEQPDDSSDDSSDDSRPSDYNKGGKLTDDDRELKQPEPESQYHEILTHLRDLDATTPDSAVTIKDIDYDKNSASPSLSTLYRYRMLERDDSTPPYQYWVSSYGVAYLAAHGRADGVERPGVESSSERDGDDRQRVGTVAAGGDDDAE